MFYRQLTFSIGVVLSLLTIPFTITPALADSTTELDSMVVTSTRTAITSDKLLSSVSVITREEIDRYQYQTVVEAIQSLPGVIIANTGGLGKQTSLFLRGTESNHTQIIVDGMKLATSSSGAPQLEHIPINQIDRIELVRGPQSSLYGSEAIGGIIQIFTRKGGNGLAPKLAIGYGTHDTKETSFALSGGDDTSWFNFGIGAKASAGFDACDGRSGRLFIGCYADEPDNDSYRNTNASLTLGHRFANNAELEGFSLYSEGHVAYDGYYNETRFRQHTVGSQLTLPMSSTWSIKTTLSQGRMNSDNSGATASNFTHNKQNNFSLQNDIQLNDKQLLTIGYDYENDKIDSSDNFAKTARDNHAVFTQLIGSYADHDYRLALRNDDNEQFGSHTTGNIAWGKRISDKLRLTASYGTAFVAPSFLELYYPYGSNPNLEPERSQSIEFGLSGQHANIIWAINAYHTKIDDLIINDSTFTPQNIAEARIKGIELEAATQIIGIDINAQYSLLSPKDNSGSANDGNTLPRRAKRTFTLNAGKAWGKLSLAGKLFVSDRRFDDAANTRKLGGYTTVDVTGTYQLNKSINLQLKVANLFDADYESVLGYNTDSTNLLFSVNYRP